MKISKILTTTMLVSVASTSYAASTSSRISDLENRIAKIEKNSVKLNNFLKQHKLFGRLQYDKTFVTNNNDLNLQNNSKLRRGRIGLKGKLSEGWSYKYEVDFAADASNVTDAYLKKSLSKNSSLKVGQFKEPFSLEELTSSRFITFLERSSINGFAPGRKIGVGYNQHFKNVNFYSGVFGDSIATSSTTDDETSSATARLTFFNKSKDGNVFHLGVAHRFSEPSGDSVRYKFKPESSIETSSYAVDTSSISNANKIYQSGVEAAIVKGRVSVQGEYINTEIDKDQDNANHTLEGHYVQFSYFLTDDKRNYKTKSSAFSRVKPTSKKGAWEIAYRFSDVESNSGSLTAGNLENNSVALNYYATDKVRLMVNYIDVNVDDNSTYGDDAEILAFRAQIDF